MFENRFFSFNLNGSSWFFYVTKVMIHHVNDKSAILVCLLISKHQYQIINSLKVTSTGSDDVFVAWSVPTIIVAWSAPSHYLNQCWNIIDWTLRNKLHWNFNRNSDIFIHENVLEYVSKMVAILSQPQCVKWQRMYGGIKFVWVVLAVRTSVSTVMPKFRENLLPKLVWLRCSTFQSCLFVSRENNGWLKFFKR